MQFVPELGQLLISSIQFAYFIFSQGVLVQQCLAGLYHSHFNSVLSFIQCRYQSELNRLVAEEEVLGQKRKTTQQLRTSVLSLESDKSRLEQEIAEIEEKLGLLSTQTGAKCPLCERELGEDHRRLIEEK